MEHIFKDLWTGRLWPWIFFVVALILGAVACVPYWTKGGQWWLVFGACIAVALWLLPAIIVAAHKDHQHILTVCFWSLSLAVMVSGFIVYSFIYTLAGDQAYDKLLSVVPVIIAAWAAAIGWFIHFKLTQKAHRTNNAFAIVMETRKSSEFRARADLVSKHFPPGTDAIPEEYRKYFCPKELGAALKEKEGPEKERAEAILALKYVLNYYEFMAVGIRVGDLEENLIYDTLRPTVCNLFDRSSALISHLQDATKKGADKSSWCDLVELVKRWKERHAKGG